MNTVIPDRYLPAADFEKRATSCDFPVEVWQVAAELVGTRNSVSPCELEKRTLLAIGQIDDALQRLLAKRLIRKDVLSWQDFIAGKAKSLGPASSEPVVAMVAEPVVAKIAEPEAPKVAEPTPELPVPSWVPEMAPTASAAPEVSAPSPTMVTARLGRIPLPRVSPTLVRAMVGR